MSKIEVDPGKSQYHQNDCNVKGVFYLTRECVPLLQRGRHPHHHHHTHHNKNADANDDDAAAANNSSNNEATSSFDNYDDMILDPGRVINIGSVTGILPQDAPTHAYDISKAAVHHLTKKMASDLAQRGITVNAIAPGYVLTRMSKGLSTWTNNANTTTTDGKSSDSGHHTLEKEGGNDDDVDSDKILHNLPIPLRRMGNGDDMGGACIYLSSRAGAYCTGTVLVVDGGIVGAAKIQLSNL